MRNFKYILLNIIILILFGCSSGEKQGKAEPKATVLISYFDNTSDLENYKNLSKGLADMLISDLSSIDIIRIVEREKLESILSEIELASTEYFDPKTAQQLGKGLGADLILTGAFLSIEPMMRIDARIIDVGTGEILQGNKVEGNITEFFQLRNQLASLIIKELDITVEGFSDKVMPATSLSEVLDYSKSIDYLDRGFDKQATELLQKTLEKNPDFAYANVKINEIKNRLSLLEEKIKIQNREKVNEMMKSLNPRSKEFGNDLSRLYSQVTIGEFEGNAQFNTRRMISEMVFEMDVMDKPYHPWLDNGGTIEDIYMINGVLADFRDYNNYEKIVEVGLPYLERAQKRNSPYVKAAKITVEAAVKRLERRQDARKGLDSYLLNNPNPWVWKNEKEVKRLIDNCEKWAFFEKEIELRKDYIFYLIGKNSNPDKIITNYISLIDNYEKVGNVFGIIDIYNNLMNSFSDIRNTRYINKLQEIKMYIDNRIN